MFPYLLFCWKSVLNSSGACSLSWTGSETFGWCSQSFTIYNAQFLYSDWNYWKQWNSWQVTSFFIYNPLSKPWGLNHKAFFIWTRVALTKSSLVENKFYFRWQWSNLMPMGLVYYLQFLKFSFASLFGMACDSCHSVIISLFGRLFTWIFLHSWLI